MKAYPHGLNQNHFRIQSSPILKKILRNYIKDINYWFNSRDVHNYLESKSELKIWRKSVVKYLKRSLNKSYKRWSSRPSNYNHDRTGAFKKIFAIEFSNIIERDTALINIDEVHFSKSTKQNYSWLGRWISWKRNNICFQSSMSFILVITSLGNWFAVNLTRRNNSSSFIEFVWKLREWIQN